MTTELIWNQQRSDLEYLRCCITELGLASELLDNVDEWPVPTLIIAIEKDYLERDRIVTLHYIPTHEDELKHLSLLQFYGPLAFKIRNYYQSELEMVLIAINKQTPLGSFSIYKNDIALRYVHAIANDSLPLRNTFNEILLLLVYVQDMFSGLIEQVNEGHMSATTAIAELNNFDMKLYEQKG